MKASKIRITKCYLIEICDKDGNELECDYSFVSRKDAEIIGKKMLKEYNEDHEE